MHQAGRWRLRKGEARLRAALRPMHARHVTRLAVGVSLRASFVHLIWASMAMSQGEVDDALGEHGRAEVVHVRGRGRAAF